MFRECRDIQNCYCAFGPMSARATRLTDYALYVNNSVPSLVERPGSPPRAACVTLGAMTRAQLDKRPADVAAMFDAVAERYDLLNDVLSLGQVRLWRRVVAQAVAAGPGERVLDLAAGTGTSSRTFTTTGAFCI